MAGRVLVELVEDDDVGRPRRSGLRARTRPAGDDVRPVADADPHGATRDPDQAPAQPGDRPRAWLRRHWRVVVPTAALVAAGLAVTQGVLDARERARLARLATIPGVLAPVDRGLEARWRADAALGSAITSGTEIDGRIVVLLDARGAFDVIALDARTGRELWRTPVDRPTVDGTRTGISTSTSPETGTGTDDGLRLWTYCTSVPHGTREVAVCSAAGLGGDAGETPATSLWSVDPATGTLLARHTVPGSATATIAGPDLVVASRAHGSERERGWQVVATDLVTGEESWTFATGPLRVTPPQSDQVGMLAGSAGTPTLTTTPEGHVLVAGTSHVWQLSPTGAVERSLDVPSYSWIVAMGGGVLLTNVYDVTPGGHSGQIVLPDGSRVVTDDVAVYLSVDDGSAPDVFFTASSGGAALDAVRGRDASTGAVRWTHVGAVRSALLLDARLYLAQADGVVALDARTGRELWRVDTDYAAQELGTDGTALLVPGPSARLAAYSLGSGHELWSRSLGRQVAGPGVSPWWVQGIEVAGHLREVVGRMDDGAIVFLG